MKKLVLLLSVLVLLVAATGAVSAAKPAPDTFTITGTIIGACGFNLLPNGHEQYCFTAEGSVTGDLVGTFTFEEWVDYDPATGKAKNEGVVTITTPEDSANKIEGGTAIVRFDGRADISGVWGKFRVEKKEGTGAYINLKGHGDFTGDAAAPGEAFSVKFTGKLKD